MKKISKKITLFLQENFGFDNREIKGFLLLLFLMILLLFVPFFVDLLWKEAPQNNTNTQKLDEIVANLTQSDTTDEQYSKYVNYPKYKNKKKYSSNNKNSPKVPKELFEFNPNEIEIEKWEKLGLRTKIAQNIRKYIDKGGKFRTKESLKKVYGFPEDLYEELEPYINIPKEENQKENNKNNYAENKNEKFIQSFDLNLADTTTLMQIRGVGLKTALNIIKYRDKLGGFTSLDQLNEVYILKKRPEVIEEIKKYAQISENNIKKIRINSISEEELNKNIHFKGIAKIIINYRKQHGKYKSIDDFKPIKIVTPEFLEKVAPLLSYE